MDFLEEAVVAAEHAEGLAGRLELFGILVDVRRSEDKLQEF